MTRLLAVEPLTKAAFAPYGEVLERTGAECRLINEGTTDRLHALAAVEAAGGGRPVVSIFAGRRRPLPLAVTLLERHPLGSQCFFPLQPFPWLVVVGDQADDAERRRLRCFSAEGTQGVNYRAGTWHAPLLIVEAQQDFLVVDRDGPGENYEEVTFAPVVIAMKWRLP